MNHSFPFLFDTDDEEVTTVTGRCHLDEEGVVAEFRYEAPGSGRGTTIQEAKLAYSEIAECQYYQWWFGAGVRITPISLKTLERFPPCEEDQLVFRVKRENRNQAQLAAAEIEFRVIEARRVG